MNTKVGFGALSVLEQIAREYIDAHTVRGVYVGNVNVLLKYDYICRLLERGDYSSHSSENASQSSTNGSYSFSRPPASSSS